MLTSHEYKHRKSYLMSFIFHWISAFIWLLNISHNLLTTYVLFNEMFLIRNSIMAMKLRSRSNSSSKSRRRTRSVGGVMNIYDYIHKILSTWGWGWGLGLGLIKTMINVRFYVKFHVVIFSKARLPLLYSSNI